MLPEITRQVGPPRALFVDAPFGYPMGQPHDGELQKEIEGHVLDAERVTFAQLQDWLGPMSQGHRVLTAAHDGNVVLWMDLSESSGWQLRCWIPRGWKLGNPWGSQSQRALQS